MLPFDVVKVIFYNCDFRTQINIKKTCRKYYTIPIKVIPHRYGGLLNDDILLCYPYLEFLYLCNISKVSERGVKKLRNLKILYAYGGKYNDITDHGVKELKNLNILYADGKYNDITDHGVKELKNLTELYADYNTKITDLSVKELPNLKILNASANPNITDLGVKELKNLTKLYAYKNRNITIVSTDKLRVYR